MNKVNSLDEFGKLLRENKYIFIAIPVEDEAAQYRLNHCLDAFLALDRLLNDYELRGWLKHGGIEHQLMIKDYETKETRPMTGEEAVEWMRDRLWQRFDEEGIDLDKALE